MLLSTSRRHGRRRSSGALRVSGRRQGPCGRAVDRGADRTAAGRTDAAVSRQDVRHRAGHSTTEDLHDTGSRRWSVGLLAEAEPFRIPTSRPLPVIGNRNHARSADREPGGNSSSGARWGCARRTEMTTCPSPCPADQSSSSVTSRRRSAEQSLSGPPATPGRMPTDPFAGRSPVHGRRHRRSTSSRSGACSRSPPAIRRRSGEPAAGNTRPPRGEEEIVPTRHVMRLMRELSSPRLSALDSTLGLAVPRAALRGLGRDLAGDAPPQEAVTTGSD